MSLKQIEPMYAIGGGDHAFENVKIEDVQCIAVQVEYSDIVTPDVLMQLEQSINGAAFDLVPGSQQILDPAKGSHTWTWPLVPKGIFLRAAIYNSAGKAGIISRINIIQ